jgi:hypothetical protein
MASPPYPEQRRSSRLQFRCRVRISGKDSQGNDFHEDSETVSISKFGASLRTSRPYALGQTILVHTLDHGSVGLFQVVWIGEAGTREAGKIGIELLDARRFWGIEYPPEDWGS